MNSYNGFSPARRLRALRWLTAEYDAGRRTRPTSCDACGQARGLIEAHSEDYGEPFGAHVGRFALCYRCHMLVHCRFRAPAAFEGYVASLELGHVWPPIGRSWADITAMLAGATAPPLDDRTGGDPGLLRAMATGTYNPADGTP